MQKKSSSKSKKAKEYSTKSSESATAVKKPLISTKKKIGIAIYFTFLATLALIMGAQILLADVFSTPLQNDAPNLAPQTEYAEVEDSNLDTNSNNQNSIDPNFYVQDTQPSYDNPQNLYSNESTNQLDDEICENGYCIPENEKDDF